VTTLISLDLAEQVLSWRLFLRHVANNNNIPSATTRYASLTSRRGVGTPKFAANALYISSDHIAKLQGKDRLEP
jgi:hypothetical protein